MKGALKLIKSVGLNLSLVHIGLRPSEANELWKKILNLSPTTKSKPVCEIKVSCSDQLSLTFMSQT